MHIHVVKRGDTLSSIAAMHDALPAFVAADNGLTLSTPLVIGQALVVRTPKTLHTVRAGETLSSIARDYDLSVRTLLRRNFFLHGRELLREGDVLAIDYEDEAPLGTLGVNAYAYPYIGGELLDSVLPYLTYLTPFTYGITPAGVLAPLDDARLLERAARYGAKSLMHLSTLTPEGNFSSENAAALLQNDRAQSALLAEILQTMAKKGYYGLDVDFEYVPPELREDYAAFVCRLREALNLRAKHTDYELESSKVVLWSSSNWSSSFTISKGASSGIEYGDPVITEYGALVGQVTELGETWATVSTLIDVDMSVGAFVGDTGTSGMVMGEFALMKNKQAKLTFLADGAQIFVGDEVLTSGQGGAFPQGLVIGTITAVQTEAGGQIEFGLVQPQCNFESLVQVFVIKSFEVVE